MKTRNPPVLRFLHRVILRLAPRSWGSAVIGDLHDEARARGKGRTWQLFLAAGVALRLRLTVVVEAFRADVRFALRSMVRSRLFAAAGLVTFALGIGTTIAVLSITDQILFRPLPYAEPDRLVQIHNVEMRSSSEPSAMLPRNLTVTLAAESQSFSGVAFAYRMRNPIEGPDSAPLNLIGSTFNLLDVLGVRAFLGRGFAETEVAASVRPVMLAYDSWRSRFGASGDVLGRRWGRANFPYEIIGVLPPGFIPPLSQMGLAPDGLVLDRDNLRPGPQDAGQITSAPIARLRPGVSVQRAQAEVEVVTRRLRDAGPETSPFPQEPEVQPLQVGMFMFARPYTGLVALAAAMVLLMAAANLSALLLVRGRSREREFAVRSALGASRWRIVSSLWVESTMICVTSSALALIFCIWIQGLLLRYVPDGVGALAVPVIDVRMLGFTLAMAAVCAIAAGIAPAWQSGRTDVQVVLQTGTGRSTASLRGGAVLLSVEVALGVVLVSGAAMTGRSLLGLVFKSPGFVAEDLYVLDVRHRAEGDDTAVWYRGDRLPRVRGILAALENAPGVEAAGIVSRPMLDRWGTQNDFWEARGHRGGVWGVTARTFDALNTPVLHGRALTREDVAERARSLVVNPTAADLLWPGQPLSSSTGKSVTVGAAEYTVVGVVADIRRYPGERPIPSLFLPITSSDVTVAGSSAIVMLRMSPDQAPDREVLQTLLNARFPTTGLAEAESISEQLGLWLDGPRFRATLFGSFATIALVLAAIGLFALAAFEVTKRRFEMGVRLALGATARDLKRSVIGGALRPVLLGAGAGLIVTWWAGQFLQAFLFEVDARDPWTFGLVAITLVATAVAAAWLPAQRAAHTDPAAVLRAQ